MRTRTIWKRDQYGSYPVTITEPAAWWRRALERLLWRGDRIAGFVGPVLFVVLGFGLLIALAVSGFGGGSDDGSTGPPATFTIWPPATPPSTSPPLPSPPLR